MKILVACEYSGRVRDAFLALGHDAWSCDLLPTDVPGPHYQCDVREVLRDGWDMLLAFPSCQYLCASGMHWTTRGLRDPQLTEDALDFVVELMNAPINKIVVENPVGAISKRIRKPDQIIQPWWFGDDASKRTCLWLTGLPPLEVNVNDVIPPKGWSVVRCAADMLECEDCGEPFCPECNTHYADCECIGPTQDEATYKTVDGILFATLEDPAPKMLWANQTPSGQNKLPPSDDRWKLRSTTYPGVARALAAQYGGYDE